MAVSSRDMVRMFRALSDPTRVEIVQLVSTSPRNVSELTSLVGVSQPKVSRHLKILRDAGLLNDVRRGKWVWYEIARSGGEPGSTIATAMNMLFGVGQATTPATWKATPTLARTRAGGPEPALATSGRPTSTRTRAAKETPAPRAAARKARRPAPREAPPSRPEKAPSKVPSKVPAKDIEDFLL